MQVDWALRLAGFALALSFAVTQPSIAESQQKKAQPRNQYTVPSDQEHWIDRSCANFNT
jgi:hypothetical protein